MLNGAPAWVRDAIFYQVFPDRFARSGMLNAELHFEDWDSPPTAHGFKGGDLFGVIDRLDYLTELGVTAIYFNPVFASASNHRYHTYDYFQVDPLLGGNDALRQLLDEAHQRDVHVVLDGVFNHASRGFWQFHHVLENGQGSPFVDWFTFDPERLHGRRKFQPYPDDRAEAELRRGTGSYEAVGYAAWWNLPALPKFNITTPAVREFLLSVAEYWVRFGIDGWRLDVPNEIDDDNFWREFRRRVRAVNPDAYIVGEVWGDGSRWLNGDMWDGVMNYQLTAACLGFFGGSRLNLEETRRPSSFRDVRPLDAGEFARELDRLDRSHPEEARHSQLNLLDSHDMPRFLTCVGNDVPSLKLAWLLLCTLPGAPCIYYGDEIGLSGGHDPDCRKSFPRQAERWDTKLRMWYRDCLRLRKKHPSLRDGNRITLLARNRVYVSLHQCVGDRVIAVFNAGDAPERVEFQHGDIDCITTVWYQWPDGSEVQCGDSRHFALTIPPQTAWILSANA